MIIDIPQNELDILKQWVGDKIQATFDDPWSFADDEQELIEWLKILRNICNTVKIDYLQTVRKQATPLEMRNMCKILPDCELAPAGY